MTKMELPDWLAMVLLVIGGLNWGLVGLFKYDLVASLFGGDTTIAARVVYDVIGLAAIYLAAITLPKSSTTRQ